MARTEKKVVVLQSNYLPWKGYFDLIRRADLFVFYDDVQFTKNDWRNRNKIKTRRGAEWISIPCGQNLKRLINEVTIEEPGWQVDHWRKISASYVEAPYFKEFKPFFEKFYLEGKWTNLSVLNQFLIVEISKRFLKLRTEFTNSTEYQPVGSRMDRLVDVLRKAGATEYISGPSAKDYLSEERLAEENIKLTWMDYSNYAEYTQLYPPFIHEVSIIDLLFNTGPEAIQYIQGIKSSGRP